MELRLSISAMILCLSVVTFCQKADDWRDTFTVDKENLGPTADNHVGDASLS